MAIETETETHSVVRGDVAMETGRTGQRRKLHGRAFYESIGSPKLVLAPMVEQSEFVGFFIRLFSIRQDVD